ncbi:hypothetical protein NE237_022334 [Protea cynaroides]|uniref:Uncharacterized protein n=1 Tax=Protea cynaroides TaxID=273540 RepID=A0A9Q0HD05_9MAGN|nr:hypothetical protein NE237_022334 [Protea cynaroides]
MRAISSSLSGFPTMAFDRNLVSCGLPLLSCNRTVTDPSRNVPESAIALPLSPGVGSSSANTKPRVPALTHRKMVTDKLSDSKLSLFIPRTLMSVQLQVKLSFVVSASLILYL